MMFRQIFTSLNFSSFVFFAVSVGFLPVAGASVLNIEDGTYRAEGTLHSARFLPDVHFRAVRRLSNGVIEAKTRAFLFDLEVGQVTARLRVVPTGPAAFDLLDLDNGSEKSGAGTCDVSGCSFTATVMSGTLTLTETWIASTGGFRVVDGAQTFHGNDATYEADFRQKR